MSAAGTAFARLPQRVRLNLQSIVGRAYPRVIGANREPSWIFFEAILPLLGIAAYVFIYQALGASRLAGVTDPAMRAQIVSDVNALVGTVVLGGTMIAFWLNVLWSMASQLYWEKEIGNLQLYMMAPMSRMALLGGMALGGMFMTSVRAITTLVVGVLVFSVVLQVVNAPLLLAVFFVTLIALYGMGMMLASLYLLWGREAFHLSALLEEPIFFTSGFYFPVGGLGTPQAGLLGRAVLTFATFIPATLGLDAMRQLIFPGAWGGAFWVFRPDVELVLLVVLAIVFLILARYTLAYLEMLARREGRLTSRHQ